MKTIRTALEAWRHQVAQDESLYFVGEDMAQNACTNADILPLSLSEASTPFIGLLLSDYKYQRQSGRTSEVNLITFSLYGDADIRP